MSTRAKISTKNGHMIKFIPVLTAAALAAITVPALANDFTYGNNKCADQEMVDSGKVTCTWILAPTSVAVISETFQRTPAELQRLNPEVDLTDGWVEPLTVIAVNEA